MSDKLYSPIIYDPISKIYYKQELNTHVGIVLNAQQQFVNKLVKQRDQYKAENEQLKAERESMISDFQKKLGLVRMLKDEINELKQENKALRLQADTYFDEWQSEKLKGED